MKALIDAGMLEQNQNIEEFSKRVEKQYLLEKKYNEIVENIKLIKVSVSKYKKTYILNSIDDVI